jgi:hypothetical protein
VSVRAGAIVGATVRSGAASPFSFHQIPLSPREDASVVLAGVTRARRR